MNIFGAIEAGGTKFICGVGTGPDDLKLTRIRTTSPEATIKTAVEFLRAEAGADLAAVGIGSFGPVDLDTSCRITVTSRRRRKPVGNTRIWRARWVPLWAYRIGFDTDVNAAALAETRWGAARDVSSCLYLTIGTGIGGGAMVDGRPLHGLMHPEMGHIRVPHDQAADPYRGCCPFHGDCLEGLASGPAIEGRWGIPAEQLPGDHPGWALEARYLALAVANFVFTMSPGRVIMGGGVMRQAHLFDMIRGELASLVNGYIRLPEVAPPGLGDRAGVLGGLVLSQAAKLISEEVAAPR